MEEIDKYKPSQKLPSQGIDYYKIVKILFSRWYWVAASVLCCWLASEVYLWYTPKTYATSAILKLEDKKSEISDLTGVTNSNERSTTSRIQSESIILQSTPLLLNAIKRLDYRFSFYVVGRVLNRTNELYPAKPLNIQLIKFDSLDFWRGLITFKPLNKKHFTISYGINDKETAFKCSYGIPFTIGPTSFIISYGSELPKTSIFLFKLNAPEDVVSRIRRGLRTSETAKNSNLLSLQQTDANPDFAADALNAVIKEYVNYGGNQRRQSASNTIDFIDRQLDFLASKLNGSENSIQAFKQGKKMMDLGTASDKVMNRSKEIESQIAILKINRVAINQLQEDVVKGKDNVTLNFNVGGQSETPLDGFITDLNNLLLQKNALLKTYNANSAQIQDINQRILQVKANTINNIIASRRQIETKIKYLEGQLAPVNQEISRLPVAEREMGILKRDFEVNDKVYTFLSERKLDQQIISAGILPGVTIVDLAQPNYNPVSPDVSGIHRSFLIFGLAFGIGIIIFIRILNPFIYDKETIESLTTIPILGVIRKFPAEIDEFSTQIVAISKPKSVFAESVRSVRTNLSFLASEKKSKVICITSEVAGEGKSFVGVNLSSTLSLIDKKVILVAADLRRSKLHKTFNVNNDIGLSNYLANQCTLEQIIHQSNQSGLDFIVSGSVPPNPSELLHSERMTGLISDLSQRYDIIMIDTAPIGLVSDAIPLIRMSDINLFVLRSGKSKFHAATIPQRLSQEYKLNNTFIILNAFEQDHLHSRYYTTKFTGDYSDRYYYYSDYTGNEGSGYYVDDESKKWWQIWKWFK
jgi:tyrosine-protein kinase Etk/Wzc